MKNDSADDGSSVSNAGVGRALFVTRFMLSFQAARMCFWFGCIPGILLALCLSIAFSTPSQVGITKLHIWSHLVPESCVMKWRIEADGVAPGILVADTPSGESVFFFSPSQARELLAHRFGTDLRKSVLFAYSLPFGGLVGYFIVWILLHFYGAGRQDDRRLRGAKSLVSPSVLAALVRKFGASPYSLIDVPLPKTAPMAGILIEGTQGTGKSAAMNDLMLQVFKKPGRKSIIYDHTGDYFRAYYRPGIDYFFNPALVGSVPWSIFAELIYTYDAETLGYAFLPDVSDGGNGKFFRDAARTLFTTILRRLAELNARHTRDIATAIIDLPPAQLDLLIENSIASSAIGGDSKQQRQGVISSIAIYLSGIAAVQPGVWSMRQFLEDGEDSRFFIVNTDDTNAMFAPLYRLMLSIAFDTISSFSKVTNEDRYWFFLDEVHALGDIGLDKHLAQKRKYGVCIATGIQSGSQFTSSMGKDRSNVILNCFNTLLALRTNEDTARKRIADFIGDMEINAVSRNQNLAVTEWRDGSVLNEVDRERFVVMASELGYLPNCVGFLKLSEGFAATTVDYRHWWRNSWWRRLFGSRADAFAPVQELPGRDPAFILQRTDEGDALESLRARYDTIVTEDTESPPWDGESPPFDDGEDAVFVADSDRELLL